MVFVTMFAEVTYFLCFVINYFVLCCNRKAVGTPTPVSLSLGRSPGADDADSEFSEEEEGHENIEVCVLKTNFNFKKLINVFLSFEII